MPVNHKSHDEIVRVERSGFRYISQISSCSVKYKLVGMKWQSVKL